MARLLTIVVIGGLLASTIGLALFVGIFLLSARTALDTPSAAQLTLAELGKDNYLIPADAKARTNPQPALNPDAVANARRVYTARCTICHGADGKGVTTIGQITHPRAADLTSARTRARSDGALYWLVANGIPHTAMPGWRTTLSDEELWQMVAYIRLLPQGTESIARLLPTPTPTPTPLPTATPLPTPTLAPTSAPRPTSAPTLSASSTMTVTIENYNYLPPTLTIAPGTRVVWLNLDDDIHNAVSEDKPPRFGSPVFDRGESYSFVFTQPGTYRYFCEPHDFMHAVIIVK